MVMTALKQVADCAGKARTAPDPDRKERIARAFGRAAPTYDAAARLQRQVAHRVRSCLPPLARPDAAVLDLGCGTGRETLALGERYPQARLVGLDLSCAMLARARRQPVSDQYHWVCADMEAAPLPDGHFDLIFSSLAVQWCSDLTDVLRSCQRLLAPGGHFVFSTLAQGTLQELHSAWQQVDGRCHINRYAPLSVCQDKLKGSGLRVHSLCQHTHRLYYSSVVDLLREIKALGANTLLDRPPSGLTGRGAIARLEQAYQAFADDRGLPASWQVVYAVVQKPLQPEGQGLADPDGRGQKEKTSEWMWLAGKPASSRASWVA